MTMVLTMLLSAVVDLPEAYNDLTSQLSVDVFTSNAGYRGTDRANNDLLWSGTTGFDGFKALSCKHGTPLLLGEIGWHQIGDTQDQADPLWINRILSEVCVITSNLSSEMSFNNIHMKLEIPSTAHEKISHVLKIHFRSLDVASR